MGNRLSKIYTRTGDDGTTGLGDGSRVPKDGARVEAYGCVDEANSAIGVILAVPGLPVGIPELLTRVQHELFDLGGELCIPGYRAVQASQVTALEDALDAFHETLPPLKEFILPGGGPAACPRCPFPLPWPPPAPRPTAGGRPATSPAPRRCWRTRWSGSVRRTGRIIRRCSRPRTSWHGYT